MIMEKVYIVTSGEYSDYHIDAVFSTREKAEEFVSVLKLNDPVEIVEWNVDGIIEGDEAKHYEATFAYETGELLLTEEVYMHIHLRPTIQAMPDNGGNFNIKIQFSTAKTDAVRKIASEIFMQVKALQPVKFPYLFEKAVNGTEYRWNVGRIYTDSYPLYDYQTGHILFPKSDMRLKDGVNAIAVQVQF